VLEGVLLRRPGTTREPQSPQLGILYLPMRRPWATLELPYRKNCPNLSAIPSGSYLCQRIQSPKFGETFEVQDVPNRKGILFHYGNTVNDTQGCILLGTMFDATSTEIRNSRVAFQEFLLALHSIDRFKLSIEEVDEQDV